MSTITANGIAGIESGDLAAARLLLDNVRGRLENLHADVISFYQALEGPPGSIRTLAAELLDPDLDPPCGSRQASLRPLTAAERELLGL